MAKIVPFPDVKGQPHHALTKRECEAVHALACSLMRRGRATGVSTHNDRQYMCVFDRLGEPYLIGRDGDVCYLFDHNDTIIAQGLRFEVVLESLEDALSDSPR